VSKPTSVLHLARLSAERKENVQWTFLANEPAGGVAGKEEEKPDSIGR